jgi:hypothetical protein
MATKKDYIKTAETLHELYVENMDEWGKIGKVDFTDVVLKLAKMYEENNPRFDKVKFLYASTWVLV